MYRQAKKSDVYVGAELFVRSKKYLEPKDRIIVIEVVNYGFRVSNQETGWKLFYDYEYLNEVWVEDKVINIRLTTKVLF